MGPKPGRLFARALAAAREALDRLDPDQVPADLKRVAGHSGTLPLPLEVSLMRGIDRYEWLREKALDEWPDADPDSDGGDGASALLLHRPPGWTVRVNNAVEEVAAAASQASAAERARENEDLRKRVDELRRRMRSLKQERDEAERERSRLAANQRSSRQTAEDVSVRREEAAAASEQQRLEEIEAKDSAIAGGRREIAELRTELRRERDLRARLEHEAAARDVPSWAGDPLTLAARIDELAAAAAADVVSATAGRTESSVVSLQLPSGVRPDAPGAIDWLRSLPERVTVVVDGYNVGFRLAADPVDARSAVEAKVAAVASGTRCVFLIVYDSEDGSAGPEMRGGPIRVRFAPAGTSADDEIAAIASTLEGCVVISSDREVRERTEAFAVVLWGESLLEWAPRR